ncbi:unnamed protein product [Caenorhabditis sp. 36 PRJEB53466]|nr:unnamed protein product [Caenorhabditis sp. 36 PRJEB53466]
METADNVQLGRKPPEDSPEYVEPEYMKWAYRNSPPVVHEEPQPFTFEVLAPVKHLPSHVSSLIAANPVFNGKLDASTSSAFKDLGAWSYEAARSTMKGLWYQMFSSKVSPTYNNATPMENVYSKGLAAISQSNQSWRLPGGTIPQRPAGTSTEPPPVSEKMYWHAQNLNKTDLGPNMSAPANENLTSSFYSGYNPTLYNWTGNLPNAANRTAQMGARAEQSKLVQKNLDAMMAYAQSLSGPLVDAMKAKLAATSVPAEAENAPKEPVFKVPAPVDKSKKPVQRSKLSLAISKNVPVGVPNQPNEATKVAGDAPDTAEKSDAEKYSLGSVNPEIIFRVYTAAYNLSRLTDKEIYFLCQEEIKKDAEIAAEKAAAEKAVAEKAAAEVAKKTTTVSGVATTVAAKISVPSVGVAGIHRTAASQMSFEMEESINTGEDHRFVAIDMKKLKDSVKDDLPKFALDTKLSATLASNVRVRESTRTQKRMYVDTDSDLSDDDDDKEIDIAAAVREIDEKHKRQEAREKHSLSISLPNPDEYNTDISSDFSSGSRLASSPRDFKRMRTNDGASAPGPNQRRSVRIQDSITKKEDYFFKVAVARSLESEELSEGKPAKKRADCVPSVAKARVLRKKTSRFHNRKSRKSKDRDGTAENSPTPDVPKRVREYKKIENYSKKVSPETVESLYSSVMTPTAPGDCQILDHFRSPVLRRAIVNKNVLCYVIVMLQVLLRVPQIYSIVCSHTHKEPIDRKCIICLMTIMVSKRPTSLDHYNLLDILKTAWEGVAEDKMNCVMEAMQHFFNRFDEEYMLDNPLFAGQTSSEISPIRNFFEIKTVNRYTCLYCWCNVNTTDKAVYLSIDISKKSNGNMQSLVDDFETPVKVSGMTCPICENKEFVCVTVFEKLPEVLLYFVPRVTTRDKHVKDSTVVEVQQELTMKDEENEHKYALCAFVVHDGKSGNKGHFKTFEVDRTNEPAVYNEYNDSRVSLNAKLPKDTTVVLAMFRKVEAVVRDSHTDVIFDGRGNIIYAHPNNYRQRSTQSSSRSSQQRTLAPPTSPLS